MGRYYPHKHVAYHHYHHSLIALILGQFASFSNKIILTDSPYNGQYFGELVFLLKKSQESTEHHILYMQPIAIGKVTPSKLMIEETYQKYIGGKEEEKKKSLLSVFKSCGKILTESGHNLSWGSFFFNCLLILWPTWVDSGEFRRRVWRVFQTSLPTNAITTTLSRWLTISFISLTF